MLASHSKYRVERKASYLTLKKGNWLNPRHSVPINRSQMAFDDGAWRGILGSFVPELGATVETVLLNPLWFMLPAQEEFLEDNNVDEKS